MKNTTKTKLWASKWCIVGLVFFIIPFVVDYVLDTVDCSIGTDNLFIVLINNIFPAISTICFFSGAWEILNKRSFAKEVLELSNVSENYIESGITHVYKEFTEIDWKTLFKGAKKVTFFFTYAYSWRSNNRTAIDLLKEQKTEITIILPDYNDAGIVNALNYDFKYASYAEEGSGNETKDVRDLIKESETYYKKIGASVKLYSGNIRSTYYFIDDVCIFAPFKHGGKKSSVPAIKCKKGGTFYSFCERDLSAIIEESH